MTYSRAFERLVDGREDLAGLIAYGLHKLDKRSERERRRLQGLPDDPAAMSTWVDSLPQPYWTLLKDRSTRALDAIAEEVVHQHAPSIREEARRGGIFTAAWQGVVGNLTFLLLFLGLYGLLVLFGVPIPSLRIG
ncbi:hypothetical protein P7L75_25265 [Tistrella mobilis]|uniref:hypothetical protein n=1 Tax=Tistrella mobilis TaxID=171437 RepID=UPI0035571A29